MYDTQVFDSGHMLQALSTHPQAIIREKLYHNIYYMYVLALGYSFSILIKFVILIVLLKAP